MASKKTREEWLQRAIVAVRPLFKAARNDRYPKKLRVSCSWPGGGSARKRIGECWSDTMSKDGTTEIFISPNLDDPIKVLGVLIHELVHAIVGLEHGHKTPFRSLATAVGLCGKMTATEESEELKKKLRVISKKLGKYPHARLDLSSRKKQTTRMIKCVCKECGYTCRTTQKWLESTGAPLCACNEEQMEVEIK